MVSEEKNCFQREFAIAKVEKVFERGPKQVNDHGIIITFGPEPTYERDSDTSCEGLVNTSFILQLWMFSLCRFKLDGDFFPRDDVSAYNTRLVWSESF